MKETSQTSRLFKKVESKIDPILKEKDGKYIYDCFKNGKNLYMRSDRLESSSFDTSWVDKIEECIPDLADIIANPKETTKAVANLVPIELARKTTAESVMHLASHSQYVKDITENGDIIPGKVLNIANEAELHTYENRFIATLVRKLLLFIEKRYEFVQHFAHLHDEEVLYFKSKTMVNGAEVEVETKVKVKSPSETKSAELSSKYYKKVTKIREYVLYFYKSPLLKALKTEKNVRAPILMTNILRKNVKYHHCYELYRFIEKYDNLGVSYKVDENVQDFSTEEMDRIAKVMTTNYLTLKSKDKKKYLKQTTKTYKPKVLTSLDDESFVYGSYLSGPIEFLRVDQDYLDYRKESSKVEVPEKMNKQEKVYYKADVEKMKKVAKEESEIEKLARRKKKEQAEFEKKAKAIIAQREKQEAIERQKQEDIQRAKDEARIEEVRRALISKAKAFKQEQKESKKKEKLKKDE